MSALFGELVARGRGDFLVTFVEIRRETSWIKSSFLTLYMVVVGKHILYIVACHES